MAFAEIVQALCERQQHTIHRGTIHALLYGGGFLQRESRWFAAPDSAAGARQLRETLVETLVLEESGGQAEALSAAEAQVKRIKAIHRRLAEIIHTFDA